MKSLHAFIKKETMEQFRSGRLMILGIPVSYTHLRAHET